MDDEIRFPGVLEAEPCKLGLEIDKYNVIPFASQLGRSGLDDMIFILAGFIQDVNDEIRISRIRCIDHGESRMEFKEFRGLIAIAG
ncbi:hypothetical protein D3C81_201830 [compost metagenome]